MGRIGIVVFVISAILAVSCSKDEMTGSCNGIRLSKDTLIMQTGESYVLTAVTDPAGVAVKYSSSDQGIVAVEQDGTVTALNVGAAVITAEAGGLTDECVVNVMRAPSIGDYYFSDGTFSSSVDAVDADVVGIVFWSGNPAEYDPLLAQEHPECTHGLVVSLTGMDGVCWQSVIPDGESVGDWVEANTDYMSVDTDILPESNLNRIVGYSNTKAITEYNCAPENAGHPVDLIAHLDAFRASVGAPALSSGWYIPSAKELTLLCYGDYEGNIWDQYEVTPVVMDAVNIAMEDVADAVAVSYSSALWSCTESGYGKAFEMSVRNGTVSDTQKSYQYNSVRFILAF